MCALFAQAPPLMDLVTDPANPGTERLVTLRRQFQGVHHFPDTSLRTHFPTTK